MALHRSLILLCVCAYGTTGFIAGVPLEGSRSPLLILSPEQSRRGEHTELHLFRRLFRRQQNEPEDEKQEEESRDKTSESGGLRLPFTNAGVVVESVDLCIVGGGVAGLIAAATAADALKKKAGCKVMLLEASDTFGGRVQSDTKDGFVLDRGFAVFIEQYPTSKKLLDYSALKLGQFKPGALVKISGSKKFARVSDPLRQPEELITSVLAPVGSFSDKLNLLPLIFHAKTKTVADLFEENETNTLEALEKRWQFSPEIIERFFKPFLEGIYLAPLEEQSSRMFSFVFKMFSDGSASLPEGGMGKIAEQLVSKASEAGVDLHTNKMVTKIEAVDDVYHVTTNAGKSVVQTKALVVATEGPSAQKILSQLKGFESCSSLPEQPQRSVACRYYAFNTSLPATAEPILYLNGIGTDGVFQARGDKKNPINNVCFPSVVSKGYAPEGSHLCSVTILQGTLDIFEGNDDELDAAVRLQLAEWFPDQKKDILEGWELKGTYEIANAQPGQLRGPLPANVYGGRPVSQYRGKELPKGVFICGDHVASATLNGALESGLAAGTAASASL